MADMNLWVGVVGTIVGATIAGGLMLLKEVGQRKHARQTERRALVIHKLEQLHQELTDIDAAIGNLSIDLIGVAALGEKLDLSRYTQKIRVSSVMMLAGFYAPQLLPHLQPLQKALVEFYQITWKLGTTKEASESERLAIAEEGMKAAAKVKDVINTANKALENVARSEIHGA